MKEKMAVGNDLKVLKGRSNGNDMQREFLTDHRGGCIAQSFIACKNLK